MQKKYRIAVLGIGGVGGFLGGKLASAYSHSTDTEVIFIARGAHAQAIKDKGLELITADETVIVHPDSVVTDPASAGPIDLLLCCTKAYDLESSISALAASITPDTVILPLLNGVDSTGKVLQLCPRAKVLDGCIYIVSKLAGPGVVQQRGAFYSLHFGSKEANRAELERLLELLQRARINTTLEDNIEAKVWSKFSFISPIATYTSAYDISIGKILEDEAHIHTIKTMMMELIALAASLGIHLPVDSIEKNFQVMAQLPYEATSSMQADFARHSATELETLTGYVVRKAAEQHVPLIAYPGLYERLLAKQ